MILWPLTFSASVSVAAIVIALYLGFLAIYRLFFSPLSKFPGPKLAALTLWYEFYYDVIRGGQYTFHIRDLHAKYGPIVRINPYELHVSDPSFYDTLYASSAGGEKRNKWEWYTKQFGTPESMFSTTSHDQHKARRAALGRFFSMGSVRKLQPVIEERTAKLVERFRGFKDVKGTDGVIKVDYAYAAFTNARETYADACKGNVAFVYKDVVMEYSYGRCDHRIEDKAWGPEYLDALQEAGKMGSLLKQIFFIFPIMQSMPERLAAIVAPAFALVLRMQREIAAQIAHIKKQPRSTYQNLPHPTLFHEILSSNLPEADKSLSRLTDEAIIIIGAGTVSTGWALTVATYHLLANPEILAKLKTELKSVVPNRDIDTIPLAALENSPYLVAVVQEAIRLSYGVATRLQRICPDKAMIYRDQRSQKEWVIPPGIPVGMTGMHIQQDPSIFPDPFSFRPERWIENPRLDRFLLSFSKGTRQCLGINLAYAEMYLCLFAIFSRFGSGGPRGVRMDGDEGVLELFETGVGDVEAHVDAFAPMAAPTSRGVGIKVRTW